MKCIVFGGGGFIGSAVVDQLLSEGHFVRVFERPGGNRYRVFLPSENVEWVYGDFCDRRDVVAAISGMDVVFHLISCTLPKSSVEDPIYDVQTNVVASIQLLQAMQNSNAKKIIFISSGGTVYGKPQYLPIDEKHPTNPLVPYGIAKLSIEKYLLLYQELYGIKTVILRVANPYGVRQKVETAQGAVAVFFGCARQGTPVEIWGDGSIERDYLHIDDVAQAFSKAVRYEGPQSVFNIGSGRGTSLNRLVDELTAVFGRPIAKKHLQGRPYDVPKSILDISLAQQELLWTPQISLQEGLLRTLST